MELTDERCNQLKRVVRLCPHHQSLKDGGLTDDGVFLAIVRSSQARDRARWAVKQDFMARGLVNKDYPGIPYRVEANGDITLTIGGFAIPASQRQVLRNLVKTESEKILRVPGIAVVSLE